MSAYTTLNLATLAALAVSSPLALAADAPATDTQVPVTVVLEGVRAGDTPLYVSMQTQAQYRSMEGAGRIFKETVDGAMSTTLQVPAAGDYAVTLWHDLDNDGEFSMAEDYSILDGWGSSGVIPAGTAPTFANAKVSVPHYGATLSVRMIYPEN